ncbi:hydroxyisourate hydrolase [Actinobacillus pleuropneumoniae]|uniref:hydroxyisourate hydrolase n=1 Tax=Actinobacillus pleuropneumoniae TaxID=715 RepID=UPI0012BA60E8
MNLNRYIIGGIAMFTASVCAASPYQLSTHILDINKGKPTVYVQVELSKLNNEKRELATNCERSYRCKRANYSISTDSRRLNDQGGYKLKFRPKIFYRRQEQSFPCWREPI